MDKGANLSPFFPVILSTGTSPVVAFQAHPGINQRVFGCMPVKA